MTTPFDPRRKALEDLYTLSPEAQERINAPGVSKDWGDVRQSSASLATGRELDQAGLLGMGQPTARAVAEERVARGAAPVNLYPEIQDKGLPLTAEELRSQVISKSGTGSKGMVYATDDAGGVELASYESAMRRGLRIIDEEEMKQLAEANVRADEEAEARAAAAARPGPQGRSRAPVRPSVSVQRAGAAGRLPGARPISAPAPANQQEGISTAPASVGRDTSSAPGGGDAEFRAAQEESDTRMLGVALGTLGANVNEAISGVGYDEGAYRDAGEAARSPVARLLAQREADKRKALEDPTSEASRRVQASVAKALPGIYTPDELAQITAADADKVTQYGSMRQRLEERKADMARQDALRAAQQGREDTLRADERDFQAQQAGASRAFQAREAEKQRAQQRELATTRSTADVTRGTGIPGLEIAPGAAPTPADATTVKKALVAKTRMSNLVGELKKIHEDQGTELVGADADRMRQLMTAIKLEAKTLAELGAITGPDLDIINQLSGSDPTGIWENTRAFFTGGYWDNTKQALDGVEKWAQDQLGAAKQTYGYRDVPQAAPTTQQGRTLTMPDGSVWEELPDGSARKVK